MRKRRQIGICGIDCKTESLRGRCYEGEGGVALTKRKRAAEMILYRGLTGDSVGDGLGRPRWSGGACPFMCADLLIPNLLQHCRHGLWRNRHARLRLCGEERVACGRKPERERFRIAEEVGAQRHADGSGLTRFFTGGFRGRCVSGGGWQAAAEVIPGGAALEVGMGCAGQGF